MAARQDPNVGHYVYVPFEGREYRIYYEENGSGIPLVCLHTAGTDGREYRHQIADAEIAKKFRVIAFDLPSHGKSNPPAGWDKEEYILTSAFYAGFTKAFCEALDLQKPVVMGSSMGGNVCLDLAYLYPTTFRALIAIEGCDYSPGWILDILQDPRIHSEVCANSVFGLMAPQSPWDYRMETWWYYAQGGPGIFRGDLYYYSIDHDFREKIKKIDGKTPIYFITGEYDFACTAAMSEATAKKIPNAEFTLMEGIGHFPMSENPVNFKSYLMPVLNKIS